MSEHDLSFWGWGRSARYPSTAGRLKLGVRMRLTLGFGLARPERPPRAEDLELRRPRIEVPPVLRPVVSTNAADRARHTYGRAYPDLVRGFRGDFRSAPDAVLHPRHEDDLAEIFTWASHAGVAVIPFGGGTSVVGGVETKVEGRWNGVVSVDLGRFDQVLEVDKVSRAARVQAGMLGPQLERQLGLDGLTLRHYPQSFEFSTVGGWIATRSGGHFATGRTRIDEFVESTRMLTPQGVLESRRLPGSGAGPSPDRLMMGSEGILGILTEAWLRVQPKPRYRSRAQVRFDAWERAVDAVRTIVQAGLQPSNCRLLDAREARLNQVVRDGSHVLLLAFESPEVPVRELLGQALCLAEAAGGRCPDGPRHREVAAEGVHGTDRPSSGRTPSLAHTKWRKAFFEAPYLQSSLVSLGVLADTFETACTWDRFPELHRRVMEEVGAALVEICGQGHLSCRLTHAYPDGPAPYFTFLAPARRGGELEQWAEVKRRASDILAECGATITHHHAVGRTHRPWYARQAPELFQASLAAVKRELDPAGILNPGVLLRTTPAGEGE